MQNKPVDILWVEDSLSDIMLIKEALKDSKIQHTVQFLNNGLEAMEFLHKRGEYANSATPDIIVLDLNMPRKNGKEVLEEVKTDDVLKKIPVIILSTSSAHTDIMNSYALNANCYIIKPFEFEDFVDTINKIQKFWLTTAEIPKIDNKPTQEPNVAPPVTEA